MAFGGITVANLVHKSRETLGDGRISEIAQPEKDEPLIAIKNDKGNHCLQMSASASLPLIYLTDKNKPSPVTAPNFCMLLCKHIGSARIVDIGQPGLGHIVQFGPEHLNEMGNLCHKKLIVEIMDKHSSIIFCREDDTIIDSIKHVSAQVSSVHEILPGRSCFIPQIIAKENLPTVAQEAFHQVVGSSPMPVQKAPYGHLAGISPTMAGEIYHLASINSDYGASELSEAELLHLHHTPSLVMEDVKGGNFVPVIIFGEGGLAEYAAPSLACHENDTYHSQSFRSMSRLLEEYYASRDTTTRIRQESSDLRRIVQTSLERNYEKYGLQLKQLKDTEKREKYHIYGKLLNTYGYGLTDGEKPFTCLNYHTGEEVTIPLDTQLSAKDNAKEHLDKYNKLRRTYEALADLTKETRAETDHPESISSVLDIALAENNPVQIKEELMRYGYIEKHRPSGKKLKTAGKPFHYIPSGDFHICAGKNDYQNEKPIFKLATGNDWWFHAKGIPGSRAVVKARGRTNLPNRLFEEAGFPIACYSKGCDNDKVEIDCIQKKNIKETVGAAPRFVIYHINYSLAASPGCVLDEMG